MMFNHTGAAVAHSTLSLSSVRPMCVSCKHQIPGKVNYNWTRHTYVHGWVRSAKIQAHYFLFMLEDYSVWFSWSALPFGYLLSLTNLEETNMLS